jgi:hypothetical protein
MHSLSVVSGNKALMAMFPGLDSFGIPNLSPFLPRTVIQMSLGSGVEVNATNVLQVVAL